MNNCLFPSPVPARIIMVTHGLLLVDSGIDVLDRGTAGSSHWAVSSVLAPVMVDSLALSPPVAHVNSHIVLIA